MICCCISSITFKCFSIAHIEKVIIIVAGFIGKTVFVVLSTESTRINLAILEEPSWVLYDPQNFPSFALFKTFPAPSFTQRNNPVPSMVVVSVTVRNAGTRDATPAPKDDKDAIGILFVETLFKSARTSANIA